METSEIWLLHQFVQFVQHWTEIDLVTLVKLSQTMSQRMGHNQSQSETFSVGEMEGTEIHFPDRSGSVMQSQFTFVQLDITTVMSQDLTV